MNETFKSFSELAQNEKYSIVVEKIINDSLDFILILSHEGIFNFVNDFWESRTGFSKDETLGHHFKEFIASEDLDQSLSAFDNLLQGSEVIDFETRFKTKEGNLVWISIRALNLSDLHSVIAIGRDTTQYKEKSEALEKKDSIIQDALDSGDFAWWELNIPEEKLILSEEKLRMLEYTKEEMNPIMDYKKFLELVNKSEAENLYKSMRDHIDGKTPLFEAEYQIKTKSGNWKWFKNRGKVVKKDSSGNALLARGVVYDVTKLKGKEIELNNLLISLEDNVYLIDLNGNILEVWEKEKAEIIPIKKTDVGKNYRELLPLPLAKKIEEVCNRIIMHRKAIEFLEKSPIHTDRWFRAKIIPVFSDETKTEVVNILMLTQDVTEDQKVKLQLEQKIDELERMNTLMIDREVKMKQLKDMLRKEKADESLDL